MVSTLRFFHAIVHLILFLVLPQCHASHRHSKKPGSWKQAHATFYEGDTETYGGACGYKDVVQLGYGLDTVAVSNVLFEEGKGCGGCYEIQCINSQQWCKPGQPSIFVTVTDNCPPSYQSDGWCNPPRQHFDLAKPAYLKIAEYKAGIVPVQYRRVPCNKQGGIKFTINGHQYWNEVSVWNVAGSGDVKSVQVKGDGKLRWTPLTRSWGHRWTTGANLTGQALTFRVQGSDGRFSTSWRVTPKNWQFGQTFQGKNFRK